MVRIHSIRSIFVIIDRRHSISNNRRRDIHGRSNNRRWKSNRRR